MTTKKELVRIYEQERKLAELGAVSQIEPTGKKRFRLQRMPGNGERYGRCECCNLRPKDVYILTIEKEMKDDPEFSLETWWRHAAQFIGHHECLMLVVKDETTK